MFNNIPEEHFEKLKRKHCTQNSFKDLFLMVELFVVGWWGGRRAAGSSRSEIITAPGM